MDKKWALEKIKEKLMQSLDSVLSEAASAKLAATHEESKAENKYDTRGLEASYLAEAQSKRAAEIKKDLYNLEKVTLPQNPTSVEIGCVVEIYYIDRGREASFFILPVSGIRILHNKKATTALSLDSPLGKLLFGRRKEETLTFRKEVIEIVRII